MFSRTKPAVLATIACLVSAGAAYGQVSTATITGVVQDNTGAVILGATIVVVQTQTNATSRAVSSDRGAFTLNALPVGPYSMTVTFPGFAKYERTNILLTVGQIANIDLQLTVGAQEQTITVNTAVALINPTDPTISDTIDQETIVSMPLNGRSASELIYNAGGVSDSGQNTGTGQLASTNQINPPNVTVPNSTAPAVNGVRAGGTFFSLDGAPNIDPNAVIGGPFPDPDATQEFQVVTGTFGARYVSAPGGAVNIVTRAGTNKFHGTIFEFIRNGYFNANNALSLVPDSLKRNQFGGTLGGPVLHDKLFFFASYQGSRIAQNMPSRYQVPTTDERNGIFLVCSTCDASDTPQPFPVTALPPIFGPNTQNAVNANFYNYKGSGNPLIPLANTPGNVYTVSLPSHTNSQQYVGRIDYQASSTHRDFIRVFSDRYKSPYVDQPTTAPYNVFKIHPAETQNWDTAVIGDTWTPTQHLVFETRASFLNIVANQDAPPSSSFINYPSLGAQNYSNPNPAGIGITVIGSTIPPATAGNAKHPRTDLAFTEDVIYTFGRHELTVGGDLQRIHNGTNNPAGQTGVIVYAGVYSQIVTGIFGNITGRPGLHIASDAAYADFYLGHPIVFIQGDGFFSSNHGTVAGVYAQDKFRATDRLTLIYGLRYDPFVPYKVENNQISCYRPGQKSTVYTGAPTGLIYPGDPNCPTGGVGGQYNVVQPRVGVAYQLNTKGTQAIRAGYGLYNIQVPLNALTGFQSFPFTRQFIFTNPFQSITDIYGSNGATNPFSTGFNGFGYKPANNVTFPTNPPPNAANFASGFRPGYVQQYSLSYQFSVGNNDSFELAYVGTKGTHLSQAIDLNQPTYIPGVSTGVAGSCGTLAGTNLPAKGSACSSTGNEQARRPNQGLAILSTATAIGFSNYSGGQITYNHRLGAGFNINSNFTYQKCIDNGSNPGSTASGGGIDIDYTNQNFSRGLCDFNQPLNFRNTVVYTAPKLKQANYLTRTALGGWQLTGRFNFDSGQPFSVITGSTDNSYSGNGLDRADHVPGVPVYVGGRLNFKAFTTNAAGTLGNTGRNAYNSSANYRVDTGLNKTFALTDRFALEFRAEAFNVINHPNYFAPLNNFSTANAANFDVYQNSRDPRQLQFALKILF